MYMSMYIYNYLDIHYMSCISTWFQPFHLAGPGGSIRSEEPVRRRISAHRRELRAPWRAIWSTAVRELWSCWAKDS